MGDFYGGVFVNDGVWCDVVVDVGNVVGDLVWLWLLYLCYCWMFDFIIVDMCNFLGKGFGYLIFVVMFFECFVGEGLWVYVDMFGFVLFDDDCGDVIGCGVSGYGVCMLIELAMCFVVW